MLLLRNTGYTEAEAHLDGVHVFCYDLSAKGNEAVDLTQKITGG